MQIQNSNRNLTKDHTCRRQIADPNNSNRLHDAVDSPTTSRYPAFREPASAIAWRQWIEECSDMQYSLLWFQPYLEKRTQEFQIIQCPSASYHYPCLSLFSCKEWAEGQVGTLNMASCPPCRGNMCIDLPVKHLWVTVSSALGNSRLPDIRSFAQEHGCKVSEIVNMSIMICRSSHQCQKIMRFIWGS